MKQKLIVFLKIAILAIIFFWLVMIFTDYFRVRQNKNPIFCFSEEVHEYNDGTTYICTGAGYKYIRYNRDCLPASEFGAFLLKERQCPND